ncbi:MAG: FAD-binding oxidoreductase [Gammaproteobacteria bacterium]|nr:FAD-binding oxidoreductase [Gammaproteobacteria bacterium]
MAQHTTLLSAQFITHDVKQFIIERPAGFTFEPGQGVELAIDRPGWEKEARPFTPTSLPEAKVLEFIIKGYPEHHGMTEQLHRLVPGERLLISDPFGTINYRGPGTFIAAGAGITPFLAIIRRLARDGELGSHRLLYSNKGPADIINAQELRHYLGPDLRLLCTRESDCHCEAQRIDKRYLQATIGDLAQRFYICGPPPFVKAINTALIELGAEPDALVFER